MEELRVRAGNEELEVKGNPETIQRAHEAFYQHIKEVEEANIKAKAELVQKMKNDMAWYARVFRFYAQAFDPDGVEFCAGY